MADTYYDNVLCLLGFDNGSDGDGYTDDEHYLPRDDIYFSGTVEVDDAQSVFASGLSALMGGGYIHITDSGQEFANYALNDFTWEGWFYNDGGHSGTNNIFCTRHYSGGTTRGFTLRVNSSGYLEMYGWANTGNQVFHQTGTTSFTNSTWHHVALVIYGGVVYVYLDGGLELSGTPSTNFGTSGYDGFMIGGEYDNSSLYWSGWIDEIRVTSGVARYTGAFTPPTAIFDRTWTRAPIDVTQMGKSVVWAPAAAAPIDVTQMGKSVIGRKVTAIDVTQMGKSIIAETKLPHLSAAAISQTTIRLTLGADETMGVVAHYLYRSTVIGFTPGPSTLIASFGAVPTTPYDDTGLSEVTEYEYVLVSDFGHASARAHATTPGYGDVPVVRIGSITNHAFVASIDVETAVLQVRWRLWQGGTLLGTSVTTGTDRFQMPYTGATAATTYSVDAQVQRSAGWSDYSDAVEVTTLTQAQYDGEVEWDIGEGDCAPVAQPWLWNPDANPITPATQRGMGFSIPLPGQPMRGSATCRLRWWDGAQDWTLEISDDAGATYSPLLASLTHNAGVDGDLLYCYDFVLDAAALADGMDYRIRATSGSNVLETATFPVDNANAVYWWKHGDDLTGRFGPLWQLTGMQQDTIWYRGGRDGGYAALFNHEQALATDTYIPLCQGGDMTVRAMIWSSEGGLFTLQGRDDTEEFGLGVGIFASGTGYGYGGSNRGIFVGIENIQTWPLGCSDNYLSSTEMGIVVRNAHSPNFLGYMSPEGGGSIDGSLGGKFARMRFKTTVPPRLWTTDFPIMHWRDGATPGSNWQSARSCGRRWEVYSLRVRAELDPGDATRVRICARLDGPHVDPPDSGYWHMDEWFTMPADAPTDGVLGMASYQTLQDAYGSPGGARVFLSWSALPLQPGAANPIAPEAPPVWNPVQEGKPCTLVLQVYETDRETVDWDVGTDKDHSFPYLAIPDNYGAQELDIIKGAATIGQVQVGLIDKAQIAGDQDSGWLTEKLVDASSLPAISGRRNRLIRYIDSDIGWVVIADGPASAPQMDASYAGYNWTIRDTRDSERKIRAFTGIPVQLSCFPRGPVSPWGALSGGGYLLDVVVPLGGAWQTLGGLGDQGYVDLSSYFTPSSYPPGGSAVADAQVIVSDALLATGEPTAAEYLYTDHIVTYDMEGHIDREEFRDIYRYTYGNINLQWRVAGDTDWITMPTLYRDEWEVTGGINFWKYGAYTVKDADGNDVLAVIRFYPGSLPLGTYDADGNLISGVPVGTSVEMRALYTGEISADYPLYLETNLGQFVKDCYDGLYSPRDSLTGEVIPTGIRYVEAAVLQMTDKVLARITEPTDDLRDYLEKNAYGPSGWIAALDRDLFISPVYQGPPDDLTGLIVVDDDVSEPSSYWTAGEVTVNVLDFKYQRFYPGGDAADGIAVRDITIEFNDNASITANGEQRETLESELFGAIGDTEGSSVVGLSNEVGFGLAQDRKLYVFDRYRLGAQSIELAVRRDRTATLRAGDWVWVDLSWLPDYLLRRRSAAWLGQVVSIHDLDCAWRTLLIEEALPLVPTS